MPISFVVKRYAKSIMFIFQFVKLSLSDSIYSCGMEYGSCTSSEKLFSSAIKLDNQSYSTSTEREFCLQKCMRVPDMSLCEVVWNRPHHGCYVYDGNVLSGQDTSFGFEQGHGCWRVSLCRKVNNGR